MVDIRIIPCLLMKDSSLVKTVKFKKYNYIGDPVNTVRIFNELEVDELIFLDICASNEKKPINLSVLRDIANECFMPLSYGGNIQTLDDAKKIFEIGFEKVIINSAAFYNQNLISDIAKYFGAQSVAGSIDVKRNFFGGIGVFSHHGRKKQNVTPVAWAKRLEEFGVGEIMVTSIDRDGTWDGYDVDVVKSIADNVRVPIIASGGAGCADDIVDVVKTANISAAALGSMLVYQKKDMGVLINFPSSIKEALENMDVV